MKFIPGEIIVAKQRFNDSVVWIWSDSQKWYATTMWVSSSSMFLVLGEEPATRQQNCVKPIPMVSVLVNGFIGTMRVADMIVL